MKQVTENRMATIDEDRAPDPRNVSRRREWSVGEYKLSDGLLVRPGVKGWTTALAAACGFLRVVGDPPVAGVDEVVERDPLPVLVDGVPTWQYTARPVRAVTRWG